MSYKIISHRGNLSGSDPQRENHPDQITKVIKLGFSVEVDVRNVDGAWFLGHDRPEYWINEEFLHNYARFLFIHAKDIYTLHKLIVLDLGIKFNPFSNHVYGRLEFFFHDKDAATLTSNGYIWHFPGSSPLTNRSIAVMPELAPSWQGLDTCFAICTDQVMQYKDQLEKL